MVTQRNHSTNIERRAYSRFLILRLILNYQFFINVDWVFGMSIQDLVHTLSFFESDKPKSPAKQNKKVTFTRLMTVRVERFFNARHVKPIIEIKCILNQT